MKTKFRKNFNRGVALHLCCKRDDLRKVSEEIYFKDGWAYASQGNILIAADMKEIATLHRDVIDSLSGYTLHMDAFKAIVKADSFRLEKESKGDDLAIVVESLAVSTRYTLNPSTWINTSRLFKQLEDCGDQPIVINPRLLERLARSVDQSTVKIIPAKEPNGPIKVLFPDYKNTYGVISPKIWSPYYD